jgi:hypothetical protein
MTDGCMNCHTRICFRFGGVGCLTHGLAATFLPRTSRMPPVKLTIRPRSATRGSRADEGVRPTMHKTMHKAGAFLENRRGAGNLAGSRLSGGSWAMSEPSWPAEGRLKAGCSQDWLPHKAAHIFIIRCDAPWTS